MKQLLLACSLSLCPGQCPSTCPQDLCSPPRFTFIHSFPEFVPAFVFSILPTSRPLFVSCYEMSFSPMLSPPMLHLMWFDLSEWQDKCALGSWLQVIVWQRGWDFLPELQTLCLRIRGIFVASSELSTGLFISNAAVPTPGFLTHCTADIWGRITLCWGKGGCLVHCREIGSIPGLYPLDPSNVHPIALGTKNVCRHCQASLENKSLSAKNHWARWCGPTVGVSYSLVLAISNLVVTSFSGYLLFHLLAVQSGQIA